MLKKLKIIALLSVVLLTGCSATKGYFESETSDILSKYPKSPVSYVTEEEIKPLPEPVQRYFRYIGVIGKEKAQFVKLKMTGTMKTEKKGDWKNMTGIEYYSTTSPSFLWYGRIDMAPFVTVEARDKYSYGKGGMFIKIEPFITIADGKGFEYDISSLIRYFNEMTWFPTALLNKNVVWTPIDANSAKATISDSGLTTSAIYYFNEKGEITNFISEDRFATVDGKLIKAKWSTPMRNYKEFNGIKVPTEGEAVYSLPDGEFEYIRIKVTDIIYNDFTKYIN